MLRNDIENGVLSLSIVFFSCRRRVIQKQTYTMFNNSSSNNRSTTGAGSGYEFSVNDVCDRLEKEFSHMQTERAQLRIECEKLNAEKNEAQRQYCLYYEMAYRLSYEMHRQTEISKRLMALLHQIIPYLTPDQQAHALTALERAKQVTANDLNR